MEKPEFRVLRQGYDRYEVDRWVEEQCQAQEQAKRQLEAYRHQIDEASEQLAIVKERYRQLLRQLSMKERAADKIAKMALKEANEIIGTAQHNADSIVREALSTARLILVEIARISSETSDLKSDMQQKAQQLQEVIDAIDLPQMPKIRWKQVKISENEEPDKFSDNYPDREAVDGANSGGEAEDITGSDVIPSVGRR